MKRRSIFLLTIKRIFVLSMLIILFLWGTGQIETIQKIFYPYPYRATVEKFSAQYGVDPLLVAAVIREESKFLPKSESHKGAKGLMQLMPNTARWISESMGDVNYRDEDLVLPEKNIQYGTWYLANLKKEFNNDLILALAAYNGGSGHVKEWLGQKLLDPKNIRQEDIPFQETREYVGRVLKSYARYIKLYSGK
ncbi:lytic transglycosylase domain-containing protein [Paradesulfitobacterium ferrireducens]|uniref:lytic transglycosylase domain-containing protein n=1 Tax=Paradesulfitobacterium ferrireducens TaxID=2816476 RepID=UPI001A905491|nr:lytic transglycosylase domain-containing protein [Paradesulfitobacterium ferrireducens]